MRRRQVEQVHARLRLFDEAYTPYSELIRCRRFLCCSVLLNAVLIALIWWRG
jgi:hypothetical protein